MRKDVFFLASPECEGRGIDTKGIEKAADYVAEAFKAAGLKPAMKDGSYFQPFTVTTAAKLGEPVAATLTGPDGSRPRNSSSAPSSTRWGSAHRQGRRAASCSSATASPRRT